MEESGLDFQTIFMQLRAGATPTLSSEEIASGISACLNCQTAGVSSHTVLSVTDTNIICLCLTLTKKIIIRLSSQSLPQDVRMYYEGVMRRLCEMDLMVKLVSLLSCQDQLVSHLSTKCMAAYVINHICITGSSSSLWRHTCAEVFHRSTPGSQLDSCLWSLTVVIKGVLRGDCQHKKDVLTKLLAALDASLTCLYGNLLPQGKVESHKTELTKLCNTMCVFFDLLEVLSATQFRCGVCSSVQRIILIESRALLFVLRTDMKYFVKKQVLLFLKRTLLRRAGEDWVLGDMRLALHGDEGMKEGLLAMAEAVLQEVKAGWLQEVTVKAQASFFGGNCDAGLGGMQKDEVMLRAVSLILLKSLEISIQSPCGKGAEGNSDVQQYFSELMSFLQHHGTLSPSPDAHSCSWVSAVFAEQDDDMIESAKAVIALYLYQKSLNSSVPVCIWGCNPHCHFIMLLRSLSFDHTVLLDFLISTETCFLEFCVRYLKLLREDWMGFCRSCRLVEDCDSNLGDTRRGTTNFGILETTKSSETCVAHCTRTSIGNNVRAGPVPRLVDYGSSDESEEAEESCSDTHTNRNIRNTKVDLGRTGVNASFYCSQVLVCLKELKMAIARLHQSGLFPYNPTSLLKLLNNIEPKKNTDS